MLRSHQGDTGEQERLVIVGLALVGLRRYGAHVASLYLNRHQDIEDAVGDATAKLLAYFKDNRALRSDKELKSLFAMAVKNAAIDILRKRHGRKRKGKESARRHQIIQLDAGALDLLPECRQRNVNEAGALLDEWIKLVGDAGNGLMARVLRLLAERYTVEEVALRLNVGRKKVERCRTLAWKIIRRSLIGDER